VGGLTFSFQVFIPFTELALKVKQTPTRKTDVWGTQPREESLGYPSGYFSGKSPFFTFDSPRLSNHS